MDLGHYRLLGPLSAGRDGSGHRARDLRTEAVVEMRVLVGLKNDPARSDVVLSRLRTLRLLDDQSARLLLDYRIDTSAPYLVLEAFEAPTLAEHRASNPGRTVFEWAAFARTLADAVHAGHRVGLAHGSLSPATVRVHPIRGPVLDWSGVETDAPALAAADSLLHPCRAPEASGVALTMEADRYALGQILSWLVSGRFSTERRPAPIPDLPGVAELIAELTAPNPAERASAMDASRRLSPDTMMNFTAEYGEAATEAGATGDYFGGGDRTVSSSRGGGAAEQLEFVVGLKRLGRFRLLDLLGKGGMGAVFRAEDLSDGSIVALKILTPKWANKPQALKRFLKEARLLREVNSPYVTNFIEVNEDKGIYFLALEYVQGSNLTTWMSRRQNLSVPAALSIAADVARALSVAHERGIVHRDVKPDNILVVADGPSDAVAPAVKLSDFGIAKTLVSRESTILTQVGAILGTPLYIAPEQCGAGGEIGPWSDVYSLGVTLFHLLSGRPPFQADTAVELLDKHRSEPPPDVRSLKPEVGEAIARVLLKCMAKRGGERYADAGELLAEIERLMRGEPTSVAAHPLLPDQNRRDLIVYDWSWNLESPPDKLWPLVADTDRLNRAAGLPTVKYKAEPGPDGAVVRTATARRAGVDFAWVEHPFEWIEGRRFGNFRDYSSGPFEWFANVVELEPDGSGGTLLTQRLKIAPRGMIGKGVATVEIGGKGRKAIEAVYRRIDAAVAGRLGRGADADPFEPPVEPSAEARKRIDRWLRSLGRNGVDPATAEALGDYVARGPSRGLARIRPLALAKRLGLPAEEVVDACIHGVRKGVFQLLWDLLCPVCRSPAQSLDSLRSLDEQGRCEGCRADFRIDFGESVELVFRVHPEIRPTETGVYCLGGPGSAPHVAVQSRIAPGERLALELELTEGRYRLRGPQLPYSADFRVEPTAKATRWELDVKKGPEPHRPQRFSTRKQFFHFTNPTEREVVVRVERLAARDDALTATRAAALPLFRATFPGEVLQPGRLVGLATVTLLTTDLPIAAELYAKLGDAGAFAKIHEHFRLIEELVRKQRGSFVKTQGEGIVASFDDARDAVRTALTLPNYLSYSPTTADLVPRIGLHRGSAMVATLNARLDYFGVVARVVGALPALGRPGGVVITTELATDPAIAEMIADSGRRVDLIPASIPDLSEAFVQHVGLEKQTPAKPGRAAAVRRT